LKGRWPRWKISRIEALLPLLIPKSESEGIELTSEKTRKRARCKSKGDEKMTEVWGDARSVDGEL
jgi:hypothetical protein